MPTVSTANVAANHPSLDLRHSVVMNVSVLATAIGPVPVQTGVV